MPGNGRSGKVVSFENIKLSERLVRPGPPEIEFSVVVGPHILVVGGHIAFPGGIFKTDLYKLASRFLFKYFFLPVDKIIGRRRRRGSPASSPPSSIPLQNIPAGPGRGMPALHNVRQFMGQETLARFAIRAVFPAAEDDVAAQGICFCINCLRGYPGRRIRVDADAAEIVTHTRFEKAARLLI